MFLLIQFFFLFSYLILILRCVNFPSLSLKKEREEEKDTLVGELMRGGWDG